MARSILTNKDEYEITDRLQFVVERPIARFIRVNKVVGLETRVAEYLQDVPSFRERIGELPSDEQIFELMKKLYTSLPKELQTLEANITEASIIPETPGNFASTSAYMQSTWSDIKKRVYINQFSQIVYSQVAAWEKGKTVSPDDIEKIKAQGLMPILINTPKKRKYEIQFTEEGE